MKSEFSTAWKASSKPRKQRKYRYNAPLHIKYKFLNSQLSKELKKKYGMNSLPLRKGDEVLVMRGAFKKKKAKVASVNVKRSRVSLEGIQRAKKDGAKVNVYFSPSKIQIISLDLSDKKRISEKKDLTTVKKMEKQHASDKS